MSNQINKKYRRRIAGEAILKSLLIGLTVGCIVAAVTMLCSWFFGFKEGLYVAIGLLVVLTFAITTILYFKKYRPTTKAVARRIDELGLEERVLTMIEYEGDDSFMATAQRKDTQKALSTVNHNLIKFAVTMAMVVAICVSAVAFAGTTTVQALYMGNVISSGLDLIKGEPPVNQYTVRYIASEGGRVLYYTDDWGNVEVCDSELIVNEGEDAPMVIAVADAGYVFVGWSDKEDRIPSRTDTDIGGNIKATARFEKTEMPNLGGDMSLPYSGMNFHLQGDGNDNNGEPGKPGNPDDGLPDDEKQGNGFDTSDRNSSNMTDNGENYYGDTYGDDYSGAMGGGSSNQGIVDGYFGGMTPPGADGNGEGGGGN